MRASRNFLPAFASLNLQCSPAKPLVQTLALAAMRFTIAAIGIVRRTLEVVDRLSPRRVVKRAFRGEAP